MAQQQNGYAIVPHDNYDDFRYYALTHGVNVDYSWGNQCWDICALVWFQYGLRLATGPNGYAYECWTVSRNINARGPFTMITNLSDVKRGDVVVFRAFGSYYTGHIGFCDEDYHGGAMRVLSQNQGQGISWGTPSNVINYNASLFLGAFRNTEWQVTPPTPPTPSGGGKRKSFPWVLYANKLRSKR